MRNDSEFFVEQRLLGCPEVKRDIGSYRKQKTPFSRGFYLSVQPKIFLSNQSQLSAPPV
jgi:hypothetical protein